MASASTSALAPASAPPSGGAANRGRRNLAACRFFARGECARGQWCSYRHDRQDADRKTPAAKTKKYAPRNPHSRAALAPSLAPMDSPSDGKSMWTPLADGKLPLSQSDKTVLEMLKLPASLATAGGAASEVAWVVGTSDGKIARCLVCCTSAADHVILPCWHLCFCAPCSQRVASHPLGCHRRCPVCSASITSVGQVKIAAHD